MNFRPGRRKPRKRIRKFILELCGDHSQEFGQRVSDFITDMRAKSTEPHQKMLLEVRQNQNFAANPAKIIKYVTENK